MNGNSIIHLLDSLLDDARFRTTAVITTLLSGMETKNIHLYLAHIGPSHKFDASQVYAAITRIYIKPFLRRLTRGHCLSLFFGYNCQVKIMGYFLRVIRYNELFSKLYFRE